LLRSIVVVSKKQSTPNVKCRAKRGPTMSEKDGNEPACDNDGVFFTKSVHGGRGFRYFILLRDIIYALPNVRLPSKSFRARTLLLSLWSY
jgi:hypothetical protein